MTSHPSGIQGGRDVIASLPPDSGTKKPRRIRGLNGFFSLLADRP
jgi:hypothetical protein